MSKNDHGFLPEIWLKVDHFLMQILASLENINYIHINVLLPWSSLCGLGGLVRAKKENKAVKYLPMCCNKSKIQKLEGTQQSISYTYFFTSNFHQVLPSQPISVPNTLHVTYSFQSSPFYYLCGCKYFPVQPRGKHVAETNFAARRQKIFLPGVKNIFASWTQILRPKHMFPSLVTMKTILISFQCRSLSKNCFLATVSVLTTIKMADCEEIEAGHAVIKGK